jgi:hypothetical protein
MTWSKMGRSQFADYLLDKFPFRVEVIQTDCAEPWIMPNRARMACSPAVSGQKASA